MSKTFLYLTNDKLIALIWKGGAIVERAVFGSGDAETLGFQEFLGRHRSEPAYLVTDLIEEDFRTDTIPHVRGTDQEAILGRKLAQLYRATTFRHAIVQGRMEDGRRDDKVLFHALTNPDLLRPWVAALERLEVPLEGIYSSAILSGLLAEGLGLTLTHTLLITVVPDFGLRQTYFQNKYVKFSRLTPIIYDSGVSVGSLIAAEVNRTWQYLDSQRYFVGIDPMEVVLIAHAQDRDTIAEAMLGYPLLRYRFLDIGESAARIKLKRDIATSHAEELLVHQFAQKRIENHFADAEQRRFGVYRQARIALYGLTAGILVAGLATAMFNLYQATEVSSEIDRQNLLQSRLGSEYQTITNELRKQTAASDTVRDSSLFYAGQIRPVSPAPGPLLREVSGVLDDFPNVEVVAVGWTTSHDANTTVNMPAAAANANQDVRSTKVAGVPGAPGQPNPAQANNTAQINPNDPNPPIAGNKFHIAQIEASITPFAGDYRAANEIANRIAAQLSKRPGVTATVLVPPLDVQPTEKISAKVATEANAPVKEARFTIRVSRAVVPS